MITNTFKSVSEVHALTINNVDTFFSSNISSLFSIIPLKETTHSLANKAFANDWLNETHWHTVFIWTNKVWSTLWKLEKKNKLFLSNGQLYEQTNDVAIVNSVYTWFARWVTTWIRPRTYITTSIYIFNLMGYQQLPKKLPFYANDIQLYLTFKTNDINVTVERVVSCVADISSWIGENEPKLNHDKTDVSLIHSWFRHEIAATQPL